jgi:hypothetical protein
MSQNGDYLDMPQLDFEAWRALLQSMCGRYNPEAIEPDAFSGWARRGSAYGLGVMNLSCNAQRVVRTQRDVALMVRIIITPCFSLPVDQP